MPHWKRAGTWACVEGTPGALPPAALREADRRAGLSQAVLQRLRRAGARGAAARAEPGPAAARRRLPARLRARDRARRLRARLRRLDRRRCGRLDGAGARGDHAQLSRRARRALRRDARAAGAPARRAAGAGSRRPTTSSRWRASPANGTPRARSGACSAGSRRICACASARSPLAEPPVVEAAAAAAAGARVPGGSSAAPKSAPARSGASPRGSASASRS